MAFTTKAMKELNEMSGDSGKNMNEFKPGDVVKLISSPQKMVVEKTVTLCPDENGNDMQIGNITCVWIEDYGTPHRETYSAVVLMLDDGEADRLIKKAMKAKAKEEEEF